MEDKENIKDIFKGEFLEIWGDGEFFTLSFSGKGTIIIDKEDFEDFKKDIKKLK